MKKTIALLIVALCAGVSLPAAAQTASPVDSMKRLAFLNGAWTCTIRGGASNGVVDHLSYSFTSDGRWLIERSDIQDASGGLTAIQIWGYDPAQQRLVAHQFTPQGIFTKTVAGWQNGQFVSTRDDNGATVTLRPNSAGAFDWLITSKNPDVPPVTEACTR